MALDRTSTLVGRLAGRGFEDPRRAAAVMESWLEHHDEDAVIRVMNDVLASDDPDVALSGLVRLADENPAVVDEVVGSPPLARRLIRLLGGSAALAQHLAAHPEALEDVRLEPARHSAADVRAALLRAVGADPDAASPVGHADGADALRLAYRRHLLQIADRDLTAPEPIAVVASVGADLADLADATVEAALAVARATTPGWEGVRLAVLAMGKTGARELNYISDVDVIYVAEPAVDADGTPLVSPEEAVAVGSRLAAALSRICSAHTAAGTIWQVDPNLRPEGKAGPLVRTLASMRTYYTKWAKNWEFQALLKARPMAGDRHVGQEFVDLVAPLVWRVADDPHFVGETQAMRRRVISLIPAKEAQQEIKLGAGGLRDTEFSVQLLQLVHGRADERLRLRGTFEGLNALVAHGYVGRADGAAMAEAYALQRVLEHRIQLYHLRRTHLMPTDEPSLRRLARSVQFDGPDALVDAWRASTRKVQRLQQRIFYSPVLEAVARIPSDQVRLTSEEAQTRLRALGFNDTAAALRHIEALSTGVRRRTEIQRQLLPAMLGWFAAGPNPDHGLLAFRQVSEALGTSAWYLRALRDEGALAENLATVLASSRYAVDLLLRDPQTVQLLGDDAGERRSQEEMSAQMRAVARRHADPGDAIEAVRAVRRRELLRVAAGELLGRADVQSVGEALSDVMAATLDVALDVATRVVEDPPPLAIIAMGRWGGRELTFGSDADALVVVGDTEDPEAIVKASRIVTRLRDLLRRPGPDPAVELDLDLRPEGKGGPMVRSMASYLAYYEKWAATWEAQALLRASHGAGDPTVSATLLAGVAPLRYPVDGLDARQVADIRKLKARMESERVPRGTDPRRHVKLGPGGLSDVEWTVQLVQLQHAHEVPSLRTTGTLSALDASVAAGLLTHEDAQALREAWEMATRIRNATMLLRGRGTDTVPTDARERAAVAELLGYAKGEASFFLDDWTRRARQARAVMDRVFWGLT